jgi:hypothetical protein
VGWRRYGRRRKPRKGKSRRLLLFLLPLLLLTLAGCRGVEEQVEQVECGEVTSEPPNVPAEKVLLFGGLGPGGLGPEGPPPKDQLPYFNQIASESVRYPGELPGGKQRQAKNVRGNYTDVSLLIIGYSAGADAALIYADGYMRDHPKQEAAGRWKITGVALLGPTMSGGMTSPGGNLDARWSSIMHKLLRGGTDIYLLDDAAPEKYTPFTAAPPGSTGRYKYDSQPSLRHYDPTSCCGEATNNSIAVRNQVLSWFNSP